MNATVLLPDIEMDFELWRFAGRLYARPGVADRLLQHQDADGIWINDWLFAAWQATKGNILHRDYRTRVKPLDTWRQEVLLPWRAWRRRVGAGVVSPSDRTLYQQALRAELALEWHDQARLYRSAGRLTETGRSYRLGERLHLSLQRAWDCPEDTSGLVAIWLSEALVLEVSAD